MSIKLRYIVAIILISLGIFYLASINNNVLSYYSDFPSSINPTTQGWNYDYKDSTMCTGIYCATGDALWPEVSYLPLMSGPSNLDSRSAYFIYNHFTERSGAVTPSSGHTVSNFIWGLVGLDDAAIAYGNISESSLKITGPESPVIESGNMIGTFNIYYPAINSYNNGVVTVKLNAHPLPTQSSYSFETTNPYLNYGGPNVITLEFEYDAYEGQYAIYGFNSSDSRSYKRIYGDFTAYDSYVYTYSGGTLVRIGIARRGGAYIGDDGETHYSWVEIRYQDLELIIIKKTRKKISTQFTFWAGKPNLEIEFDKLSVDDTKLDSASFNVVVEGALSYEGSIPGELIIKPRPGTAGNNITVTITETDAGPDHIKFEEPIVLNFTLSGSSWSLSSYSFPPGEDIEGPEMKENVASPTDCHTSFYLKAKDRTNIKIELEKYIANAETGNKIDDLSGITFDVDIIGGEINEEHSMNVSGSSITSNGLLVIDPNVDSTEVVVTLTEKDNLWYEGEEDGVEPITLIFVGSALSQRWSYVADYGTTHPNYVKVSTGDGDTTKVKLEIGNIAKIQNLTLEKINTLYHDEKIPGITFSFSLQNARLQGGGTSGTITTGSDGIASLGEIIEVIDPTKDVIITLKETGIPSSPNLHYKGLYEDGEIVIRVRHKESIDYTVTGTDIHDLVYDVSYSGNVVSLGVKNEVTLDISGMVWLDGQTGLKPVKAPNGIREGGESGISGITVRATSNTGETYTEYTDGSGQYLFKDLPASYSGAIKYNIEFSFDGINYITVESHAHGSTSENDSDADEDIEARKTYNARFETITKGKSNDGTSLEYNHSADGKEATLKTTDASGHVLDKFAMNALADSTYNEITEHIDLGLERKGVDLAAVTELNYATLRINEKEITYNYDDISELGLDGDGNLNLGRLQYFDAEYNLYLYESDYNYRIDMYNLPDAAHLKEENWALGKTAPDDYLQVELGYQILLNNQSVTDSRINQIAYYYDARLTNMRLALDEGMEATIEETSEIVKDPSTGIIYRKALITFSRKTAEFKDGKNFELLNVIFDIGKDTTDNDNLYTGVMKNWVEITSYSTLPDPRVPGSTSSACIDKDSAPDDFIVTDTEGNIIRYYIEDDTDDASGLNVQVRDYKRVISGYVFEDIKNVNHDGYVAGNGLWDDGETKVDEVIVQLIEIKQALGTKLEYIWQETRSGQDTVKRLSYDGNRIEEYTVSEPNKPGEYKFEGFIPGDYIVRFIYGDGTYYDVAGPKQSTILTYNGQDYQSTIDTRYSASDKENIMAYASNASMARDNEVRRLEEMEYASNPARNVADLVIDSKDKLADTWMCAETYNFEIPVSNSSNPDDTSTVARNVNFGLMLRPRATLELEKHVTAWEIQDVLKSHADKDKLFNQEGVQWVSEEGPEERIGDRASASDRSTNSVGNWWVEVELSAITGKNMEIRYTYQVKNTGEEEYIGYFLHTQLNNGITYDQIINQAKGFYSENPYMRPGTYLGEAYYSGVANPSRDQLVGVDFRIEDYLRTEGTVNLLELKGDTLFTSAGTANKAVWVNNVAGSTIDPGTENVEVLRSEVKSLAAGHETELMDQVVKLKSGIVTTGVNKFEFPSYAAQLIYSGDNVSKVSPAGTLAAGMQFNNIPYVKNAILSQDMSDSAHERDEYIGETVEITVNTGGEAPEVHSTESKVLNSAEIVAVSMAVIAVGLVLIKKFAVKK